MINLETSPHPLVFPVQRLPTADWRPPASTAPYPLGFRTNARALAGMQKEAVVCAASGPAWRMVCDEGPYLLGTDLAPFPLAFFCVGMVSGYAAELLTLTRQHQQPAAWQLWQDNRYTMEGSALAGTMRGAALPVELQLVCDADAQREHWQALLPKAVAGAPGGALLRTSLTGSFALQHNGQALQPERVLACAATVPRPSGFDTLVPAADHAFPPDIIVKTQSAQALTGVAGGVGSSLTNEQKRTLHMQGRCLQRTDGLLEVTVELFSPLGSRFRFLVEPGETTPKPRAPTPAMYLSAGVAFCFLTQMGRYAHIVRKPLSDYALVQDSGFSQPGATPGNGSTATARALVTQVFIDSSHDDAHARTVVAMSEQTCFLHAACRQEVPVAIKTARAEASSH